jgi:hypothetical protein
MKIKIAPPGFSQLKRGFLHSHQAGWNKLMVVGLEVLTELDMKNYTFWDVTPLSR